MKNKELDNILDSVTNGIQAEEPEATAVKGAAERVWARMSSETASANVTAPAAEQAPESIRGCADFQSLMPAYLNGKLSEGRSLLLVDHTHECIPCRRALKEARRSRIAASMPARKQVRESRYNINPVIRRWGVAAVLVIGFGLVALPLLERYLPVGSVEATVQAAEGPMYVVNDSQVRQLTTGAKIGRGDVVRTAKDAHAVLRLDDGSVIEMKDRSEFSIDQTLRGTIVRLARGSVIVEASKRPGRQRTVVGKLVKEFKKLFGMQPAGDFFVETNDSTVSVAGTTFAVNAGTKGSRVSVVEGVVHMDRNGEDKVLNAGEQATTNAAIDTIPVKEEVSWSANSARYTQMLDSLASLKKELNAVPKPGVRHSTRLLDMMPENTVLYAAVPNLSAAIVESNRIIEEKIQQNPALREWFQDHREPGMNSAIAAIHEFGDQLGDEIAVSAGMNDKGEPVEPLVLAELKNPAGFHAFFDAEMQKLAGENKNGPKINWVDDPASATASVETSKSGDKEIYVWITGDLLVASPKLAQLQTVAKSNPSGFASSAFHNRIADVYREGAGLIVAADLEKIIAHEKTSHVPSTENGKHEQALTQLGVLNMKSFVLDQKETDGKTHTRAVLAYDPADHGITSWLAQPGPMGSLEYISPDANLVAGFVIKNPTAVVDDLLGVISSVSPDLNKHLDQLEKDHGLNLRNDFAAPLGGEYAFAIDGPILPVPSWKLVFQVNDPPHLQQTFERVVVELNGVAAKEGKKGLEWDRADVSGHTFYTLRSKDFGIEVNYVFANGYLIAGPTRALVQLALNYHDSGQTLARSAKFTAGLPADGNVNFSALVYHNLAPLVQPFANGIAGANLPNGPQKAITAMAATMEPTLAYAYAYGDRIEFAANTDGGPFGLSPATLLGMPNAFELHHILEQGMKNPGNGEKKSENQTSVEDEKAESTQAAAANQSANQAAPEPSWKRHAERAVTRTRDILKK